MDPARYKAMDAQRFDPMRRTRSNLSSKIGISKLTMGQGLSVINQPSAFPVRETVGGIWSDHDVVVVPLSGQYSDSTTSTSCSSASTSDTPTNTHAPSPTVVDFVVVPPSHTPVDVHEREDLIITRTIIRPNRTPAATPIARVFSSTSSASLPRPAPTSRVARSAPSSHAVPSAPSSRVASPTPSRSSSRPTSPVLQALNCFSISSAFESDRADVSAEQDEQPTLHVIVTQTREQYEDDKAFKQIVETVYPAAASRI
ncbi:hypothetical protein M405DRAFT_864567 [Rhizopogon salebrosus TDB-379]|nr:hypothetical protein M405DRAFT_864567 [Rhizopogon salebrosus TDB-379]